MKQAEQLAFQKQVIKDEYVTEQDIIQRTEAIKAPRKNNRSEHEWKPKSI